MGQFKPMVKMETTEPSVILKLKKGGHVDMKKAGKAENGHAPMKRMDGGVMSALAGTPALVGRPAVNAPVRAPGKPSMAMRRAAMMARPKAMPQAMPTPAMKKGGKVWEGSAKDEAQDKKLAKKHGMSMKAWEKSSMDTKHDKQQSMKGLKKGGSTGEVVKGKPGGYKDGGGVRMGNAGGFKKGGAISYVDGNVTGTPPGKVDTVTGGVKKANAGGYKKGGAAKKAFATGGLVNTGKPVAMPQGRKKPTPPVAINQLSGTFKKGGRVKKYAEGGEIETDAQQDPQMMRPRGVDGRGTIGTDGRMGMRGGMRMRGDMVGDHRGMNEARGIPQQLPSPMQPAYHFHLNTPSDQPLGAPPSGPASVNLPAFFPTGAAVPARYAGGGDVESDAYARWKANEKAENEADAAAMNPMNWFKGLQDLPTKAMELVNKVRNAPGAVTKTEKSTTLVPQKRRSGGKAC